MPQVNTPSKNGNIKEEEGVVAAGGADQVFLN